MGLVNHSRTFVKDVAPGTTEWDDVIIPSGKTIRILQCSAHADYTGETNVSVIWDRGGTNEVLCLSYGDADQIVDKEVTGDGSKKLSIRLRNNGTSSRYLMGHIEAIEET